MPRPAGTRLLAAEDIKPGEEIALGTYTPTREELLEFSRQWDPQTFHVDSGSETAGYFGDVIASGAHTVAIYQRLSVLAVEHTWDVLAGIRLSDVRFMRPVLPDRTLTGYSKIESVELVHPQRGLLTKSGRLTNPEGETIFSIVSEAYIWRRDARKA